MQHRQIKAESSPNLLLYRPREGELQLQISHVRSCRHSASSISFAVFTLYSYSLLSSTQRHSAMLLQLHASQPCRALAGVAGGPRIGVCLNSVRSERTSCMSSDCWITTSAMSLETRCTSLRDASERDDTSAI